MIDAELIGTIVTDVTHLRNAFVDKRALGPRGRKKGGHKYWELHYQLVYKIDGLNMKCKCLEELYVFSCAGGD
jgi:hypothetical protein